MVWYRQLPGGTDKLGKNLNQRIFGTDQHGWRRRRKDRQLDVKGRRKARIARRADKWAGSERGGLRGKAARGTGRLTAWLNANTGGGAQERYAQQLAEKRKRDQDIVGSGRDEAEYAVLGPINLQTGNKISQEALLSRKFDSKIPQAAATSLGYLVTKANSSRDVDQIYDRYLHDWTDSEGRKHDAGYKYGGFSKDEAEQIVGWAADIRQQEYGGHKYYSDGKLAIDNIPAMNRLMGEQVDRKSDARTMNRQHDTYWNDIGQVNDLGRQLYQKGGGAFNPDGSAVKGAGFDIDELNLQEQSLLQNLALARQGLAGRPEYGGAPNANLARQKLVQDMSWLENEDMNGILNADYRDRAHHSSP